MGVFDRKRQSHADWSGFLEHGVRFEGTLESPGTFRVDSHVSGDLTSEETLILGERASVNAKITAKAVIIAGKFDGTIHARTKVEIQSSAVVTGEIQTPCLIIAPGAIFDGRCHMLTAREPAKPITIPIRSAAARA